MSLPFGMILGMLFKNLINVYKTWTTQVQTVAEFARIENIACGECSSMWEQQGVKAAV